MLRHSKHERKGQLPLCILTLALREPQGDIFLLMRFLKKINLSRAPLL